MDPRPLHFEYVATAFEIGSWCLMVLLICSLLPRKAYSCFLSLVGVRAGASALLPSIDPTGRQLHFMLMIKWPSIYCGFCARLNSKMALKSLAELATAVNEEGASVCISPEGTRSKDGLVRHAIPCDCGLCIIHGIFAFSSCKSSRRVRST